MISRRIGRRKFIKGASSAVLGLAAGSFFDAVPSAARDEVAPRLEHRVLGRTGLKVTAVSMGVMNCSDPAVLNRAFDLGVNFYDTAHVYMNGKNEELVGKVFRGRRDKVLIQTKFRFDPDEKNCRATVETSLRRLQTDYVDVLLVHSLKTPDDVINPAINEFLMTMKKEGKARFTGFSAHTEMASILRKAAEAGSHDVALVSYNYTHSADLKEAVAAAAQAGAGIVAMKTQAGGYKTSDMGGLSPHQAALKYVLMDKNVAVAVPGVTTIEQIEECASVMGTAFARGDSDALRRYDACIQGRFCTMCGGCRGQCPHGVPHTDLLRVVMYHEGYNSDRLVRELSCSPDFMEAIKRCTGCASCSVVCSRGLDIRGRMDYARAILA
jgi:hypothetical protein